MLLGPAPTVVRADDLDSLVGVKSAEVSRLWSEKDYARAVTILEEIRDLPGIEKSPWYVTNASYNLACGYALLGRKEDALAALERAVSEGYSDWQHVLDDSDLSGLKDHARFNHIVERMKSDASLWAGSLANVPFGPNLSAEQKIGGLSKIWSEVRYNFAYFDHAPGLDWDSLYLTYIPLVRKTTNTKDYYRLLSEFCAQLRDGHTSVDVPGELFVEMFSRPPLDTRLIEDRVLIVRVLNDSLRVAGIQPGLEVVSVDGQPVRDYAAQHVAPYGSASTPQGKDATVFGLYLLCGSPRDSVSLELRDSEGKTYARKVARTYHRILSHEKPVEFRVLKDHVAYVALNSFGGDEVIAAFDSLFPQIASAKELILDVRENTGGNSSVGWAILGCLTDQPFRVGLWQRRNYEPQRRAWGMNMRWITEEGPLQPPNGAKHFKGSVAVLCGPLTASAAEDFCMAFDVMKRGTMVGERTAGSTGQPIWFGLPGGGTGRVCSARTMYPDGKEVVGRGIQPNVEVRPTVSDVRAGRDTVLDAAVKSMGSRSSQ